MTRCISRRLAAASAATLLLLGWAGCGSSSQSPEPLAKPVFTRKAEAICQATVGEVLAKVSRSLKVQSAGVEAREVTAASTVLAPALRSEVERIQALGAPIGEEDDVNAFLDATSSVVKRAETEPKAAIQDPQLYSKAQGVAQRLDLDYCPFSG
jgi:hypothetical protein